MPKVEKGNRTAIDLVLIYSALVEVDGAEAGSLRDYQKIIRKNKKAVNDFSQKNRKLLEEYPINWLAN